MRNVAQLAEGAGATLESLCVECQTVAWLGVMDLPDLDPSCVLCLPQELPPPVRELQVALAEGDKDVVADCLASALAAIDTAAVRADLADAVVVLESHGQCPARVAAAALVDLAGPPPSVFVLASMVKAVDVGGLLCVPGGLVGAVG